jgi:hypothetical protein
MKFRIEKINEEKYAIVFINDSGVKGFYVTKSEMKQLKSNMDEMIAYDRDVVGDSL